MAAQNDLKEYLKIDELRAAIDGLKKDNEEFGKSAEAIFKILRSQSGAYKKEIESLRDVLRSTSTTNPNSGENINALSKKVNELVTTFKQASESSNGFKSVIDLTTSSIAQLEQEQKVLIQTAKQVKDSTNAESKEVKGLEANIKAVSQRINTLSLELKSAKKATDIAAGSYAELSKELGANREQLRNMANAFDPLTGKINKNNTAAVQLNNTIKSQDKAIKQMDASMGNFQRNVGNYSGAIDLLQGNFMSLVGSTGILAVALIGLQQAISFSKEVIELSRKQQNLEVIIKNTSSSFELYEANLGIVKDTANKLGLDINGLGIGFKLLSGATKGTALEGAEAAKIFLGVSNAAASLRLNSEDTEGALRALSQMLSKGTISSEELRGQLAERIPNAFRLAADSIGVTTQKLSEMLKNGDVLALSTLPKLAKVLTETYGKDALNNINTFDGATNRLKNAYQEFLATDNKGFLSRLASIKSALADFFTETTSRMRLLNEGFIEAGVKSMFNINPDSGKERLFRTLKEQEQIVSQFNLLSLGEQKARVEMQAEEVAKINEKIRIENNTSAKKTYQEQRNAMVDAFKTTKSLLDTNTANALKAKKDIDEQTRLNDLEKQKKIDADNEKNRNKARTELEKKYKDELDLQKSNQEESLAILKLNNTKGFVSDEDYIKEKNRVETEGANQRLGIINSYYNRFKNLEVDKTTDIKSANLDILKSKNAELEAGVKIEEEYYKESLRNIKEFAQSAKGEVEIALQDRLVNADNNYSDNVSGANLKFEKSSGTRSDKSTLDSEILQARIQQINEYIDALKIAQKQSLQIVSDGEEAEIQQLYAKIAKEKAAGINLTNFENEQADIVAKYKQQAKEDELAFDKKIKAEQIKLVRELTEAEIRAIRERNDAKKQSTEEELQLNQLKFEVLTASVQGFFQIQSNNYQRQNEQLQASKDYELELAGDNDEAKQRIEKDYEKRQKELRIKEAKAQKVESLFTIAINTAVALSKVMAQTGVISPFLIPLTIALGAIQAAVVLAKPLPQYAKGKNKGDSYEGFALVGEAGAELVERNGQMQYFDSPTVTYTDPNTKVYTASETSRILANQNNETSRVLRTVKSNNDSADRLHSYKLAQSNQKIDYNQFMRLFKQQGNEIKNSFEDAVSTHVLPDGTKVQTSKSGTIINTTNTKYR